MISSSHSVKLRWGKFTERTPGGSKSEQSFGCLLTECLSTSPDTLGSRLELTLGKFWSVNCSQCLKMKVMLCAVGKSDKLLLLSDTHWLLRPPHKHTHKQFVFRLVFLQISWDLPSLQHLKQTQHILPPSHKYNVEFIGNKTLHCTRVSFLSPPSYSIFSLCKRSFINLVQPRCSTALCLYFLKDFSSVTAKW